MDENELYGSEFGNSERISLPTGHYYVKLVIIVISFIIVV